MVLMVQTLPMSQMDQTSQMSLMSPLFVSVRNHVGDTFHGPSSLTACYSQQEFSDRYMAVITATKGDIPVLKRLSH